MHIPNAHLSLSGGADSHTWQNVSCIVRGHACLANFPAQQVRKFKGGARIPPPRALASGLCARPICPRKCSAASSAACTLLSLVRMISVCYTEEKQKKEQVSCIFNCGKINRGGSKTFSAPPPVVRTGGFYDEEKTVEPGAACGFDFNWRHDAKCTRGRDHY